MQRPPVVPTPGESAHVAFGAGRRAPTIEGMNTMACRAVSRAALSAGTASLDDEAAWPLLLVAGWLTTAADLMLEAQLAAAVACRA